ncbi:MAG: PD40 domain-containing protein [Euryarchaeota archaeon]|nr:PD40 domain-containing protein [Euryarchaeota archaeon]
MRRLPIALLLLLLFAALLLLAPGGGPPPPSPAATNATPARVPPGWTAPVKLGFNDEGWEDSPYLSRDGRTLYFFHHPGPDLINKMEEALKIRIDGRIYTSQSPFTTKQVHPASTPDLATEAGPYVALSGDLYYHANKRSIELQREVPESIYKNGERLDLGTGGKETNPHYCDAMGELYFDSGDQDILLYKDGKATLLPAPINLPGNSDFQPFLTDDCQTMYFTSGRGSGAAWLAIYRSQRLGQFDWSEPELFISHPHGVGEFTMTADGRQMAFAQLSRAADGGVRIDIYHSRRENTS